MSGLLQNYWWVKPSAQLILVVEVTESEVECQISLSLPTPAASAEDEQFAFFFFNCKCSFVPLKNHSGRKCQVANATPYNFPYAMHTKLGG